LRTILVKLTDHELVQIVSSSFKATLHGSISLSPTTSIATIVASFAPNYLRFWARSLSTSTRGVFW
jgi:hypothetical protein